MPESVTQVAMKVKFENIAHGWMTVTLQTENSQYSFAPSAVPCDSMQALINGLGNILLLNGQVITHWNDEPIEHEFVFDKIGDQLQFSIYRLSENLKECKRELVFSTQSTIYKMVRSFWVALRDLETRYTPMEYEQRWSNPFPLREMQYLTTELKNLKNSLAKH